MALEAINLVDPSGKGGLEQFQVALFRKFLGRDKRLGFRPRSSRNLFTLGASDGSNKHYYISRGLDHPD